MIRPSVHWPSFLLGPHLLPFLTNYTHRRKNLLAALWTLQGQSNLRALALHFSLNTFLPIFSGLTFSPPLFKCHLSGLITYGSPSLPNPDLVFLFSIVVITFLHIVFTYYLCLLFFISFFWYTESTTRTEIIWFVYWYNKYLEHAWHQW